MTTHTTQIPCREFFAISAHVIELLRSRLAEDDVEVLRASVVFSDRTHIIYSDAGFKAIALPDGKPIRLELLTTAGAFNEPCYPRRHLQADLTDGRTVIVAMGAEQ